MNRLAILLLLCGCCGCERGSFVTWHPRCEMRAIDGTKCIVCDNGHGESVAVSCDWSK